MRIFDYFLKNDRKKSASIAKERLQIIVAHERTKRQQPDYVPQMQNEILAVIQKYMEIDLNKVSVQFDNNNDRSVLELNITLPD